MRCDGPSLWRSTCPETWVFPVQRHPPPPMRRCSGPRCVQLTGTPPRRNDHRNPKPWPHGHWGPEEPWRTTREHEKARITQPETDMHSVEVTSVLQMSSHHSDSLTLVCMGAVCVYRHYIIFCSFFSMFPNYTEQRVSECNTRSKGVSQNVLDVCVTVYLCV